MTTMILTLIRSLLFTIVLILISCWNPMINSAELDYSIPSLDTSKKAPRVYTGKINKDEIEYTFEVLSKIKINEWYQLSDKTWFGKIHSFTITQMSETGLSSQFTKSNFEISGHKLIWGNRKNRSKIQHFIPINVHGFSKRPMSLYFYQTGAKTPEWVDLKKDNFTIAGEVPNHLIITQSIEKLSQKKRFEINLYYNDAVPDKTIEQKNYQVSASIPDFSWSQEPNQSWFGQIFNFTIKIKTPPNETINQIDIKGFYPHDTRYITIDLEQSEDNFPSLYIYVHGLLHKPGNLIFNQPPQPFPQFEPLKPENFTISKIPAKMILIGNKAKVDFLGYLHPVINIYFDAEHFSDKKMIVSDSQALTISTEDKPYTQKENANALPISMASFSKIGPFQSLIILDVTDDDRRWVAFSKGRNAVMNFLSEIGWQDDQNDPRMKIKFATAFESYLKYLHSIKDIKKEVPKIQAPSSLKEQLQKAFNSFDDTIDGSKKVIYIISSKRADIITPQDLNKLQLNLEEINKQKSFNCIIIGDYGGNSLKRLALTAGGDFYRCKNDQEIVEKLKQMIDSQNTDKQNADNKTQSLEDTN